MAGFGDVELPDPALFDVALPDAGSLLEPHLVAGLLDARWGAGGPWRRRHVRWDPGQRLVAVYERDAGATVVRLEARPEGRRIAPAAHDELLPGIGALLEARPDARIIAYKPGESCVLAGSAPVMWKVFPPDRVGAVAGRWRAIAEVAERAGVVVPHSRVLDVPAGVLELQVLHGTRLREAAHDPAVAAMTRGAALHALGASLAAMAAAGRADALPARDPGEDAGDVRDALPALAAVDAPAAARVERLVDRLVAGAHDEVPLVAGHGALRTDQVLLVGSGRSNGSTGEAPDVRRVGLVDLDGACRSVPERDLANLTAYLWWRGVRRPAEAADGVDLCAAVWSGAVASGLVPDPQRWHRQLALSLLKIAVRRYRAVDRDEWPLAGRLITEAARHVGGAR